MKNIELKPGYLVEEWMGKLIKIYYSTIQYNYYGDIEERYLIIDEEGVVQELISKYNGNKIFDTEEKALKHQNQLKKKRIEHFKDEMKKINEKLKELMK